MGAPRIHDRLIVEAAREFLGPVGFRQKGRSRLWFADHGWWLLVVEFQPSSWSQGSYLNSGAKWLWRGTGEWSFDFTFHPGARVAGFQEYLEEEQFRDRARALASTAHDEALRYRRELATIDAVAEQLDTRAALGGWNLLDAGIASFLAGRSESARRNFEELSHRDSTFEPDWQKELRKTAAEHAASVGRPRVLRQRLTRLVAESREAFRLSAWEGSLPGAVTDAP